MENIKMLERMFNVSNKMKQIIYGAEQEDSLRLGRRQLFALSVLNDNDRLNMTMLAERIAVSNQQLTKIVENLVNKGLVSRYYDPSNRRVILIELTDSGREYLTKISNIIASRLDAYKKSHSSEYAEVNKCVEEIERFLDAALK